MYVERQVRIGEGRWDMEAERIWERGLLGEL